MIKIALVDDSSTFSYITEYQVEAYNRTAVGEQIELDVFNSPVHFMQMMKNFNICEYDIVLIDINMPVINGFEIRKQLKEICREVKCFLISGTIYKYDVFKEYQSIIQKDVFNIREIVRESNSMSRFMNNLELDLYEEDTKLIYV